MRKMGKKFRVLGVDDAKIRAQEKVNILIKAWHKLTKKQKHADSLGTSQINKRREERRKIGKSLRQPLPVIPPQENTSPLAAA
jgi:hypothetical protein